MKSECPNPRKLSGACRRCGEEGHWSKEACNPVSASPAGPQANQRQCPNAPPMKCKECESTDHLVKDCPNRICKNCGEAGMELVQMDCES
jgi:hypothetical protein